MKQINVYKYSELSEKAKEKAISDLIDINVNYEWWDGVYIDAEDIGLKITGFGLERDLHATGKFLLAANEVAQNVLNNHGEDCETYKTTVSFMDDWQPVFDEYIKKEGYELENKLTEFEYEYLNSLLSDYATILQKEYEHLISEEAIKETIEANELEFLEDGRRY